ncbi:catechol 2,3-dioxygenase-like lactoylglutathione lyase family enzyme [Paraburkholderia atlantica]
MAGPSEGFVAECGIQVECARAPWASAFSCRPSNTGHACTVLSLVITESLIEVSRLPLAGPVLASVSGLERNSAVVTCKDISALEQELLRMISHVFVGVNDFDRALKFYSAVMSELGHQLKFCEPDRPWAGWMAAGMPRPLFLIGRPYDGNPAEHGNGQMVALLAPDRSSVDNAYATALANSGSCEGPPGLRTHYHPDYYGAYFRDPEENKICVCCHDPVTQ